MPSPTEGHIREFYELREEVARLDERLRASSLALSTASESMAERLAGMNEFRAQIGQERATYLQRDVYDASYKELIKRIDILEQSRSELVGRLWMLGTVATFLQFVIPLIVVLVMKYLSLGK
jgi:hypothetical protein